MRKNKVLCLIRIEWTENTADEQELWMDLEPISRSSRKIETIVPLINHLHSDRENGQEKPHYHVDTRYSDKVFPYDRIFPHRLSENESIEYRWLYKTSEEFQGITPVGLIRKSKLKHKCIHKGKCPHRGFDLSNIEPDKDNIIRCPLHGLEFDGTTKQMITNFDEINRKHEK